MKKQSDKKGQSNIGKANEMPDFFEQVKSEMEKNPAFKKEVIKGFREQKLSKRKKTLMEETYGIKI